MNIHIEKKIDNLAMLVMSGVVIGLLVGFLIALTS
ncbi:hypothetical protein AAA799E16_01447 [Marine Group I thaumarchaeote SCGC AAA799-E16]|uniref:Uncharacterized protein n=4 Tax=Marine Group I TaxID=905826 RepID=A0A087RZC0_9ARCH|nr:hypothetical protein AAA799N04_00678 [Marine Group I thaumarchaeote SCGC AAA799-N04]KER05881.1 hypothetical protein AAA799E16_01447 [Marine Group I thaumarchaeote SCGC AAA799-E16]KFM16476.1 hypothetical protein SCCGRSA3_02260 [Marine Group I thaumarchaeote SCGC RSA3]KFM18824.1 hypothetical protein AAA799P11_00945 [Marine Group I thaumarchaeote SCGC AAA799-P11]